MTALLAMTALFTDNSASGADVIALFKVRWHCFLADRSIYNCLGCGMTAFTEPDALQILHYL